MQERVLLVAHTIGFIAVFTALGSGPAIGLIRDRRIQLVAMPILGFALCASLLTTLAHFITMEAATWVALVPAAVVSVVVAIVLERRQPAIGRVHEVAIPAAVFLLGVSLALSPLIVKGTQGPYAFRVLDAWAYNECSVFLQHHREGESLPLRVARTDLTTWNGGASVNGSGRFGVDATTASAATLFHAQPAELLSPFLAVLFGLFPLVIWILVRGFGGSWQAAALGSALGLTPTVLTMVVDTTMGNIAGEILAAPALFFLMRSLRKGSPADTEGRGGSVADAVVAGALLGGLLAVYSEYLPPELIIAGCYVFAIGIDQALRRTFRNWLWLGVSRIGIASVTAIALAPNAVYRAYHFMMARSDDGEWALSLPARFINVENVGSWVFGVHHLYALNTFSAQPALHLAFSIYFPAVLAIAVLVGIVRLRASGVFVAVPIFVAVALGVYAYRSYQLGHCEYCQWKSLTFMIPFLTVGLAFGFERLWQGGGPRRIVFLQRGIVVSVAILALAAIGNSDIRLVQNTLSGGAFCRQCGGWWGDLGKRLDRLPSRSPLLIEGADTMPYNTFSLNAAYNGARGHKRTVWFDAGYPAIAYLVTTEAAPLWYSPDYEYVLTPFKDVRSNRTPLGNFGQLLLARRAPIDVVVSANGWGVYDTGPRIPQGSTPFKLRVSSKRAVNAAITLSLKRPAGSGSTLEFKSGQWQLETVATDSSEVCVNVHLKKGRTIIDATPVLDPFATSLPSELGIAAVEAAPGRCDAGRLVSPVSFYDGWFPLEQRADGSYFRWMSSVGTVEVGTPGVPRSSARIDAQARSFVRRRRVDVMLGEKRLASFEVPMARETKITVVVPSGQGVARVLFVAAPAAESASIVTPADTRLLSVAFSRISIRPGAPTSKQP